MNRFDDGAFQRYLSQLASRIGDVGFSGLSPEPHAGAPGFHPGVHNPAPRLFGIGGGNAHSTPLMLSFPQSVADGQHQGLGGDVVKATDKQGFGGIESGTEGVGGQGLVDHRASRGPLPATEEEPVTNWFEHETIRIPKDPEKELRDAEAFFARARGIFESMGYRTAVDNLDHYLSGVGGVKEYSDEEMSGHPVFAEAIENNRGRFRNSTFTGTTKQNHKFNDTLLNMKDGESKEIEDHWDVDTTLSRPSTYMAFGRGGIKSTGNLRATRKGDRLLISGTVNHNFDPNDADFDFNHGQIGNSQAKVLEKEGLARIFKMSYNRNQDVEAELQYGPDGRLTPLRIEWGPMR